MHLGKKYAYSYACDITDHYGGEFIVLSYNDPWCPFTQVIDKKPLKWWFNCLCISTGFGLFHWYCFWLSNSRYIRWTRYSKSPDWKQDQVSYYPLEKPRYSITYWCDEGNIEPTKDMVWMLVSLGHSISDYYRSFFSSCNIKNLCFGILDEFTSTSIPKLLSIQVPGFK